MDLSWHCRCTVGFALALAVSSAHAAPNSGSGAASTTESRRTAAAKFAEGMRAFDSGDFTRAGEAFEAAYAAEPHVDPLWNAARAWHRAKELARAANLYARYVRQAPATAADRAAATAALAELASKLGRIEVHVAPDLGQPSIDGVPLDYPSQYVVPGSHSVRAESGQGVVEKTQSVEAGAVVSVWLERPNTGARPVPVKEVHPAVAIRTEAKLEPQAIASAPKGWSPTVVWIGTAVTLVVAGTTIWSGVQTLQTRRDFDRHPTRETLDTGRAQQTRTNVLMGTTVGLAAITGMVAVFLVDWRPSKTAETRFVLGPRSVAMWGTF